MTTIFFSEIVLLTIYKSSEQRQTIQSMVCWSFSKKVCFLAENCLKTCMLIASS